jgi:hypothetical protein
MLIKLVSYLDEHRLGFTVYYLSDIIHVCVSIPDPTKGFLLFLEENGFVWSLQHSLLTGHQVVIKIESE